MNGSEVVHAPRPDPLSTFPRLDVRARRYVLGTHGRHRRNDAHTIGRRRCALLDSEHGSPVTRHTSNTNR